MNKSKNVLIVDLETTSLDINEAIIKVFGAYDPYEDSYFIYQWNDISIGKVMRLFEEYEYIITFNGTKYDLPILRNHGIPLDFKHIDVYTSFKRRGNLIRVGGFNSYSLKNLTLALGLDEIGKGDIDYNIFKKDIWTIEEKQQIITYLKQDLISTWKLWNYLTIKFETMSKYVTEKDSDNYKHITTNLPTYTYKVLCKGANVPELYDERPPIKDYPLVYMTTPRKLSAKGNIVLLQFNNFLTSIITQFNLLSSNCHCCMSNEGKYHGRNIYVLKGYYCQRNQGPLEKFLKELQTKSITDEETNYVNNIVSNYLYEVITNGSYYSTYSSLMPNDCISLAKQQIKFMIDYFAANNFYVLYVDNDDVFIELSEGQTMTQLNKVKKDYINLLKSRMPFPNNDFDLVFKDDISYMQFFNKGSEKNKAFMYKGQYVYVTKDNKFFSKGVTNEEIIDVLKMNGGISA